jgi:hypothetical protein
MAISYVGAGSVAGANSGTTFTVTGPAVQAGDILLCPTISTLTGGPTPAEIDGSWELGANGTAGGNRSFRLFWRQATLADSGKTWTITKGSPSTESHAVVLAFRGANSATPIDSAGFVTNSGISAADPVIFNALDPNGTSVHIVAIAFYYQDATNFTTPPTGFTLRLDAEGAVGTGSTFAVASKDGDGSSITPSNWSSNSTTDGFWASVVFALDATVFVPPASNSQLMTLGYGR